MGDRSVLMPVVITLIALMIVLAVATAMRGARRTMVLRRLGLSDDDVEGTAAVDTGEEPFGGGLQRWLGLAGYRSPMAPALFVLACVGACLIGLVVTLIAQATGAFTTMEDGLVGIPGDFGQALVPALRAMPWLLCLGFAIMPILVVRASRRRIVEAVQREQPVLLELLATLAETGLGFDAAIEEILQSDRGEGVLADEFRNFQRETLSGVPRIRCLRRLARRVDVSTFSTFISSLVQAERGGFGLAEVLRVQADDMRNRRRENALMKAQALPVKLVFPLVICFLPALFVLTLGPAFYTFFQLADSVTGNIGK